MNHNIFGSSEFGRDQVASGRWRYIGWHAAVTVRFSVDGKRNLTSCNHIEYCINSHNAFDVDGMRKPFGGHVFSGTPISIIYRRPAVGWKSRRLGEETFVIWFGGSVKENLCQ